MTRTELATAGDLLRDVAADTEDAAVRERVERQADQLADLAESDRGPDHGRLARIEQALGEVGESTGDDAVEEALEHVRAYRETVSGV